MSFLNHLSINFIVFTFFFIVGTIYNYLVMKDTEDILFEEEPYNGVRIKAASIDRLVEESLKHFGKRSQSQLLLVEIEEREQSETFLK